MSQILTDQQYNNLPKKRSGASCIFVNENNEILIAKSPYKDYWTLPGGTIEENESPHTACAREVKEELGLENVPLSFVCVGYENTKGSGECYQFVFYGGVLNNSQISQIKLQTTEISKFKFIPRDQTHNYLKRITAERILKCLSAIEDGMVIYLENTESYT